MTTRVLIAAAVLVVVALVAVVLERRRGATAQPVRDPYPIPRQLFRADFPRPEAPWLVALFSSTTCDGCEAMRPKVLTLDSAEVVAVDISFQSERAIHERYEISGVPMVLVVDTDGVVQRAFLGAVTATDLWAAVAGARDPALDISHGLDALS
ncbi:MAG: thioredoxin family protein [Acidimicrobiia bacterium]